MLETKTNTPDTASTADGPMAAASGRTAPPAVTAGLPGVCSELALLPRSAHVDARALSRILGRTVRTIDRATSRRELPAPLKFLGRRVWLVGTIQDHLKDLQDQALKVAAKHAQKILQ